MKDFTLDHMARYLEAAQEDSPERHPRVTRAVVVHAMDFADDQYILYTNIRESQPPFIDIRSGVGKFDGGWWFFLSNMDIVIVFDSPTDPYGSGRSRRLWTASAEEIINKHIIKLDPKHLLIGQPRMDEVVVTNPGAGYEPGDYPNV